MSEYLPSPPNMQKIRAESNDSALESGFFKPLLVEIPAIPQS
jgi:hypothetical protein